MTDSPMPDPPAWPQCPEHRTAYVLRRSMTLVGDKMAWQWIWQPDCKHRGRRPDPIIARVTDAT